MRKPAAERKSEIIDAVIRLADQVGPDRITTDMVADTIEVTQATIFRHFPRKEDIWTEVAVHLTRQMQTAWERIDRHDADASARLEAIVVGHLDLIRHMPALPAILLSRELHAGNEALRETLLRAMGAFRHKLAGLIEEGIASGEFRSDLPPADAAMLIIGMVQSLAIRWSLGGRSEDLVASGRRLLVTLMAGFLARQESAPSGRTLQ